MDELLAQLCRGLLVWSRVRSLRAWVIAAVLIVVSEGSAEAALVYRVPGSHQIVVAGNDGSGPRVVASGDDPVVSPDGRLIAYFRNRPGAVDSSRDLWVVGVDGAGPRRLIADVLPLDDMEVYRPVAWAPNSRYLVVFSARGAYDVVAKVTDRGRHRLPVTLQLSDASFAPNSRSIAVTDDRGRSSVVDRFARRGGRLRVLTDGGDTAWGPQGIAFSAFGPPPDVPANALQHPGVFLLPKGRPPPRQLIASSQSTRCAWSAGRRTGGTC